MSIAVGAEQYVEEHVQGHVKVFLFLYIYKIIFSFCVTLDFCAFVQLSRSKSFPSQKCNRREKLVV